MISIVNGIDGWMAVKHKRDIDSHILVPRSS